MQYFSRNRSARSPDALALLFLQGNVTEKDIYIIITLISYLIPMLQHGCQIKKEGHRRDDKAAFHNNAILSPHVVDNTRGFGTVKILIGFDQGDAFRKI